MFEAKAGNGMPAIIAPGMKVNGRLVDRQGDIQVDGRIEGEVRSRLLTIGHDGMVDGVIEAGEVRINGTVKGSIKAETVTLTRTARVEADVEVVNLAIEPGAAFEGNFTRPAGKQGG